VRPTRRDFLRLGLGSATLLAAGKTVPLFLASSARAAEARAFGGRVLVVLELSGGNDGLNTVVPYRDDDYRKHRPRLRVERNAVLRIDDQVGLHPALGGLARLLEARGLAIVQGVGYPNPSRSHFQSLAIWHSAREDPTGATQGWLNRCLGQRTGAAGGDPPALHVSDAELPLALSGRELHVPSLTRVEQVRRRLGLPDGPAAKNQRAALDQVSAEPRGAPGSHLQFIQRSALVTYASSARLEEILRAGHDAASYPPTGLGRRLALTAQLIKAGLTISIYYTQLDGFDTHVNQVGTHPGLLREFGDALWAFFDDLNRAGQGERVLTLAFSEFGRRVAENASGGTDHGTVGPVFLAGPGVRVGLHNRHPDLRNLEDHDPKYVVDFRRVYAAVLDRWLGCPSEQVLGAQFEPLPIL